MLGRQQDIRLMDAEDFYSQRLAGLAHSHLTPPPPCPASPYHTHTNSQSITHPPTHTQAMATPWSLNVGHRLSLLCCSVILDLLQQEQLEPCQTGLHISASIIKDALPPTTPNSPTHPSSLPTHFVRVDPEFCSPLVIFHLL